MPGRCWACDARQPIGGSVGDVTRSEPCGLCSSMQIAEPRLRRGEVSASNWLPRPKAAQLFSRRKGRWTLQTHGGVMACPLGTNF